jgi:hypothetical protein
MSLFMNTTDGFGVLINAMTTNITGSEILTFTIMIILLFVICMLFRIPLDVSLILMFPLIFIMALYSSSLMVFVGIIGIYMAIIMLNWLFLR